MTRVYLVDEIRLHNLLGFSRIQGELSTLQNCRESIRLVYNKTCYRGSRNIFFKMTILCKPEAGQIIEDNAIYLLKFQGPTMWSDLMRKSKGDAY